MDQKKTLILSLETATPCSSVALTTGTRRNGEVVATLSLTGKVSHSRRLLSAIDWLMHESGVHWEDIGGIAVSLGPGSFTGLRIGMATAKGLAAGAGKVLLGVSTLDSLAAKCVTDRLICSILDARKKEVYAAFYRCNNEGLAECVSTPVVLTPVKLAAAINEPVLLIGDGARVYGDVLQAMLQEKAMIAPAGLHEPSAASLGMLAGELLEKGLVLDLAEGVPIYVRSSDAELNLLKALAPPQKKIPGGG
ncbi:MAG: tRNA (adenosine(37)-N6)-threonylcarbamoyltransferase complex dimerization subunit type 1 TsaB [Proteobacteria bacterium]|nr:tRNA (adenosine(37)-N6)-threonylcarbamoyltransferase complex dimerization subunit type 1 TsaB [Pseudomonadota bacterium]